MNGMAKVGLQLEVNAINCVLLNKVNVCVCERERERESEPVCVAKMTDVVSVHTVTQTVFILI